MATLFADIIGATDESGRQVVFGGDAVVLPKLNESMFGTILKERYGIELSHSPIGPRLGPAGGHSQTLLQRLKDVLEAIREDMKSKEGEKGKRSCGAILRYDSRSLCCDEKRKISPAENITTPHKYMAWRKDNKQMKSTIVAQASKKDNSLDILLVMGTTVFLGSIWNLPSPIIGKSSQCLASDMKCDGRGRDKPWERVEAIFSAMFNRRLNYTSH
jgi:hypothetical protein